MFPTIKGNILLKNKEHFFFFTFGKVDFLIMQLYDIRYDMEFSNQLFTANCIRRKDPYTFLDVE